MQGDYKEIQITTKRLKTTMKRCKTQTDVKQLQRDSKQLQMNAKWWQTCKMTPKRLTSTWYIRQLQRDRKWLETQAKWPQRDVKLLQKHKTATTGVGGWGWGLLYDCAQKICPWKYGIYLHHRDKNTLIVHTYKPDTQLSLSLAGKTSSLFALDNDNLSFI